LQSSINSEKRVASVADKRLVLDANILVRAVLGTKARQLIERYAAEVQLFAPDTAFAEADEHLPPLFAKKGLSAEPSMAVLERLSSLVQELPQSFYLEWESAAQAVIAKRDPDDWPVLACALALDCPIWTEDRDFFGVGVATWTSNRVELFLSNSVSSNKTPPDNTPSEDQG
jgi:predicted nucleic acid-binding protein